MASTSSPTTPFRKHDVFLNFRGTDTRYSFTSHLYHALQRNQIDAFIDNQLDGGEKIEPALLEKIEDSYISVVVFTKNYADSTVCLRELSKILECMENKGQNVLPVFHQLDPSQVQNLTGSYGEALSRHETDCAPEEVKRWRHALKEVANLKGWDSSVIKDETKLIEEIVSDIQRKLDHAPSTSIDAKGLVGMQSRVKHIESLLSLGSTGVLTVGIWGMGGIGKSTTAEAVYNRNFHKFKGRCFFRNVREKSKKHGVFHVRQKILGGVLEKKVSNIDTTELPPHIKRMLQRRKEVLIVLDDVSDAQDLKFLVGEDGLFGEGSRIIVTSRDRQVLINACQANRIYKVNDLDEDDALRLFSFHAFKQNNPLDGYTKLSKDVVSCVKGIPLVLEVLGASLYKKTSVEYWESKVAQLRKYGGEDIKKCLEMCYDELGRTEKKIFLDIACFFGRCERDHLQQTLDLEERSGIDHLIDMCLIKMVENKIWMHDVLLKLGKDIVVQENVDDPSERSRLWDVDDFERVLASPGTTKVESISLWIFGNMEIDISPAAFEGMKNLRLLQFFYPSKKRGRIHLRQGLHFLSNELRILEWWKYPLKSLPSNFSPEKLAVLKMPFSELEQLWNEYQPLLKNLKLMDLSGSSKLILSDFDFSNLLNFEVLNLGESVDDLDANNLCTLSPSIGFLSQLVKLDLSFCSSLTCLPDSIGELKSQLVKLDLSFCGSLTCLPGSIGELKSLVELDLWYCSKLASLPSSIGNLTCLVKLKLSGCYELASLPLLPSSLQVLDASNCISLTSVEGIIMQGEKDYEAASQQFNFSHCPKLDQSSLTKIIGAHSRIQRMATSLFNQQYVGVRVCIPGSEVPEWFTYKNTGGPTVQPVHWHRASTTNQLFGFTLCAVVSFGPPQKYVEDLSEEDRSEEYVIEEDLNEEDLSEENRSEEYVNEEDLNEEDLREEDRSEEYVNEEDLREEDLSDLSEEDSSEEDFSEEDTLPSRAYIHEQYPLPRDFDIKCECHLITKDGTQSDLSFHYYEGNEKRWGSLEREHVFIWSIHSDLFFKEASFHFTLLGENTAHAVVQSGVHPLFVEQQQRKRQKLSSI